MILNLNTKRLINAITNFNKVRILVLGDIMLDRFIWGNMRRISPEAPVPIVQVENETSMLGGAANVLHNLIALGGQANLAGLIGDDEAGGQILALLDQLEIKTNGVIICTNRLTTVKTRVLAHNQQVVRVDRESEPQVSHKDIDILLGFAKRQFEEINALIVSDYAKGVVSAKVMNYLRKQAKQNNCIISVDPKVVNMKYYLGTTVITPNHLEAASAAHIAPKGLDYIQRAGKFLLKKLQTSFVLVTQGEHGMTLFSKEGETHIPTMAKRIYDVTGAGDTVISTLTLGLLAGLLPTEAALIANIAAGIVVGEVGTSVVTSDRLIQAIEEINKKF